MKIRRPNGRCNQCGITVRALRQAQGLSQDQLAAKVQTLGLDLTQKSISRIETGERVVADFELSFLADALNTDILTLLAL